MAAEVAEGRADSQNCAFCCLTDGGRKAISENRRTDIKACAPYKKENTGILNDEKKKLISRHEILAKLEDFIKISNKHFKVNADYNMVHRPERLVDIMAYMRQYKIEPKEIRFVCSHNNEMPKLVLIKGVKNAKSFLKIKENLNIYDKDGNYTEEILKIYNKI